MSAANMLGSRVFCALFGAVTGQMPNSVSPSLMPSSSLGSFDQVFVVSSMFDVPSLLAAWAAENNPDDAVDNGLCLNLVGKNDTIFVFSGSLDSCLVCGSRSIGKVSSMLPPSGNRYFCSRVSLSVQDDEYGSYMGSVSVPEAQHFSGFVRFVQQVSRSVTCVGCEVGQGSRKPDRIGSRVEAFLDWKLCWYLHKRWVPRIRDALLGDHCRYRHSRSCVEARHLISLPPLWVFCRFLRCVLSWLFPGTLVFRHVLGLRIDEGSISLMLPSRRPLFGGVLGLRFVEGDISLMIPFRCVLLLFKCVGERVVGLATTTLLRGPSYAAAAAATPRVDVEKDPPAAAALDCVNQSSQVPSRCLFQKHPVFLFDKIVEEREERKVREDGGDTVLLVRGLQGNTVVVQCGSGWTARDLSDSLRCRTSVPVHLFYLVVEGRVIDDDDDELVRIFVGDRVVSMRGRVLGGSRYYSPIPGEWSCPGCMRSGCWPTKSTCFRCGTARPKSPLPLCRF